MADARIVAFADETAPAGWLECAGQSLLRVDEPELFAAIGTTYGAADATHFSLPDLRARFALGKAASGTGSTLATAGGALGHTHSLAHSHGVTQPADHAAHVVTQPGGHTALTHAGFDVDDHPATSHAGMSVAAHSVSATDAHGSHASASSHDHNAHGRTTALIGTGLDAVLRGPVTHTAEGSHNHNAHSGHNESVSAHSISDQGDNHPAQAHSITQPAAHSLSAHAFTVGAHGAHTAAAAASATVTLGAADPPYLALIFIIAPATTPIPIGALLEHGAAAVPADHLLCDGQAVSRATYADLFALVGTTFGVGNGSTTFNVPDLRGRHVIGASGAPAFAATGGSANHTHAGGSHGHTTTQPGAHADHTVTQPSHSALAHSGASITAHSMGHAGFSVASHSVGQSSGHGTHASEGVHNHDSHGFSSPSTTLAGSGKYDGPSAHNNDGGHTHDAHDAHSGAALSAHVESQASTHSASHSVTQPNDHAALTHAGASLSSHSAHLGAAVNAATSAASAAAEAPYLALNYMIRTAVGGVAVGSLYKVGQAAAPSGALLAQGQAVSRSTYAELFAAIGTAFGVGDGSTTFNVPDTRGRIPRGANGDLATAGGALNHTHAVSATHAHGVVQPDAHGAHSATQASGHASLTHAGASVATHSLSHAGADINNHSATQAGSHGAHAASGGHDHNAHQATATTASGSSQTIIVSPGTHSTDGSHGHTGAHTHAGFSVGGHSVGQANAHSLGHTETQPSAHSISAHAGFAVDAHGAHTGFALAAAGTGTTDAGNPPYLVVNYVIQAGVDVFYQAGTTAFVAGGGEFHADAYELSLHWSMETAFIAGGGEFHVTAYDIELADVPLTPPSSPIIYILGAPE